MKEKQYQCPAGDGKGSCKENNNHECPHAEPHDKFLNCECMGYKCEEVKDVF